MGLLDFLGMSADQPRGLLGSNWDDPRTMAVMQAAQGLLGAPRKQNLMLSLSQAMGNYQGSMAASRDSALKRALTQSQIDENRSQNDQRAQALEMQRRKMEREQAWLDRMVPPSPASAALSAGAQAGSVGPTQANATRMDTMSPQQQAFMTPAQAAYAKMAGMPDVTEVAKFYATPQKYEPGAMYRDPNSGAERWMPKDGIGMGPQGAFEVPGYGPAQASIEAAKARAIEQARQGVNPTLVDTMTNGVPSKMPIGQFVGGGAPQGAPQAGGAGPFSVSQDPAKFREQLFRIPDPQERAQVLAAFDQRFPQATAATVGGFPQTAPSLKDTAAQGYDTEVQKDFAARRKTIYDAGDQAGGVISRYQQMGQLLAKHDGGKFSPTGLDIASGLNSLGVKVDPNLGNKEAAVALTALLTKDAVGGSLGPGISNSDVQVMQKMVPNLSQSAQGRNTLIGMTIAVEKRKQQAAQFARNYEKKYGRLDNGFFEQMQNWESANPLFGGQ